MDTLSPMVSPKMCPKCGHARTAADVAMHVVEHAQIKRVRDG